MSRVDEAEVRQILSAAGAVIVDSHLVYTSGKHGSAYINKDAVYPNTQFTSRLCEGMAEKCSGLEIQTVIGPERGGIILSQWTAHHLSLGMSLVNAVYAEKHSGIFTLKIGWHELVKGKNVLVVEDVLNTGGSVKKVIELARMIGGNVVGVAAICNRGGLTCDDLGVPLLSQLLSVTLESWEEADCPLCAQGMPINIDVGHGKEFLARQQEK